MSKKTSTEKRTPGSLHPDGSALLSQLRSDLEIQTAHAERMWLFVEKTISTAELAQARVDQAREKLEKAIAQNDQAQRPALGGKDNREKL